MPADDCVKTAELPEPLLTRNLHLIETLRLSASAVARRLAKSRSPGLGESRCAGAIIGVRSADQVSGNRGSRRTSPCPDDSGITQAPVEPPRTALEAAIVGAESPSVAVPVSNQSYFPSAYPPSASQERHNRTSLLGAQTKLAELTTFIVPDARHRQQLTSSRIAGLACRSVSRVL